MAPFIASWCFDKGLGWKYAVVTVAVLAFVMVITFSMIKIDDVKEGTQRRNGTKTSYDFLKDINFYISSGILFFYVGVEYAVNGWIVTYLKDTGIMSTSLAQKILSILWIVIIFGRLLCAHISKTINKETILLISSIGTMVFFTLFIMSSRLWTITFCILGLGFCLSGIYPTTIANAGDVLKGSGLAMGTLLAIAGLGGIIMPYITGVIAANRGITGGMTAIAVAIVFMILLSLINKLKVKRNTKSHIRL